MGLAILKTEGEAHEKAKKDMYEKLSLLEKGMKEYFPDGKPDVDDKSIGVLDIIFITVLGSSKASEEVLGVKLLEEDKFPVLFSWLIILADLQVFKEASPPHEKVVQFLHYIRNNALRASSAS